MKIFVILVALFFIHDMQAQQTYLALGDSYTIGEGVPTEKNWPNLLVKQLNNEGFNFKTPNIIATTGWRTDELIQAIDEAELEKSYDMVSLLIGVNNQYQKKPIEQYITEFEELLKTAIAKSEKGACSTFVVSIPDYGVTDFAKSKELKNVAKEIQIYNQQAKKIASTFGVPFYNITPISETCEGDASMFVEDLLHPSGIQYQLWVNTFFDALKAKLPN
jgi:lysophospholipase L1-like esterase